MWVTGVQSANHRCRYISSYDTELLVSWRCIQGLVPAEPLLSENANECLSPGIIDLEGKTLA